ncbi:MAG: GNAT family protein [Spirochaetales bacterium]|nr:GNAT family protein [Spirochaetales bacterium]
MIRLEPFCIEDISPVLGWLENTDGKFLYQFAGAAYTYPLNEKQLLETIGSEEIFPLKAIETEGEGTVGHCQLMRINRQKSLCSLGRLLINPESRGKGYGSQMLEALRLYVWEELKISTLKLRVYDFNKSALNCYKNFGFEVTKEESLFIESFGESWNCLSMEYHSR